MGFREETLMGLFETLLMGTGIWKWGWKEYYETEWQYSPQAEPVSYTDEFGQSKTIPTEESDLFIKQPVKVFKAHPFFEYVDIRHVLVDPGARAPDIRKAKFVIHELPMTYKDLMRLKDETFIDENGTEVKRYKLPSEEEIRSWFEPPPASADIAPVSIAESYANNTNFIIHASPRFQKTTEDPLQEPLEVLERWDNDKIITVLNQVKVIRNEANEFNAVPFFSVNWWNVMDSFWGIGLGWTIGSEQRVQQGFVNAVADIGTLAVNQPIIRSRGANINTQQVRARLGGFIDVDGDPTKALHPMDLPKIQGEFFEVIAASEARTEQSSGASEQLVMGATPAKGRSSLGRTATGASGLIAAAEARLGGLVEDFNRQVFQPLLWRMYDLNKDRLPASVYRTILNEELDQAYQVSLKDFLASGIKQFDVLAGSHLAVKQQMAQSMPLIMQYFTNPALAEQLADINGEFVDFAELLHMMSDAGGWGGGYYSVVKKLTPEMIQRRQQQAQGPAQAKFAAQSALSQQKAVQKAQQIDQEYTARASGELIRSAIREAGMGETVTGEPEEGPGLGGAEEGEVG